MSDSDLIGRPRGIRYSLDVNYGKRPRMNPPPDQWSEKEVGNAYDASEVHQRMPAPAIRPLLRHRPPRPAMMHPRPRGPFIPRGALSSRMVAPRPDLEIDSFGDSCVVVDDEGTYDEPNDDYHEGHGYDQNYTSYHDERFQHPPPRGPRPLSSHPRPGSMQMRSQHPGNPPRTSDHVVSEQNAAMVYEVADRSKDRPLPRSHDVYSNLVKTTLAAAGDSYDHRQRSVSSTAASRDADSKAINLDAARQLVAHNPLFSGENMKKLQEQLKVIQDVKKGRLGGLSPASSKFQVLVLNNHAT